MKSKLSKKEKEQAALQYEMSAALGAELQACKSRYCKQLFGNKNTKKIYSNKKCEK